jgi:hypothetical protein
MFWRNSLAQRRDFNTPERVARRVMAEIYGWQPKQQQQQCTLSCMLDQAQQEVST